MSSLKENGVGSNYRTLNNEPVSPFNDPRIAVEIYPSAWEKVNVTVSCDELGYNSGLLTFDTEQAARRYAINMSQKLKTSLDSKLQESIIAAILRKISE